MSSITPTEWMTNRSSSRKRPNPATTRPARRPTAAALKTRCNLNDHFGEEQSTGFTGWFSDTGLTRPYGGSELKAGEELHLYGRNRCTVRIEYAEGSLHPEEGAVYRTAASDGAPEVAGALELPDYGKGRESHSLGGIALPAIVDDGRAHKAVYWGERVAPAKPEDVYRKTSDGTWRRYVPMVLADFSEPAGRIDRLDYG